jgi:ATP-binding cassette subfamily B protein
MKFKQRDITDCGATCLATIADFYGLKIPVSRIRQTAGTDKKGTSAYGLVTAAEKLGFTAKAVKGTMEVLPKIPLPGIAHVILKNGLQHYIVITKIGKKRISYMDPTDGEMHKISFLGFQDIWSGILILMVPSDDFVKGNHMISNLRRFLYLVSPHKKQLLQALFGALILTILGLSFSVYIQKITDHVLVTGNTNLLNLLSVVMIVLLFVQMFLEISKNFIVLKTGQLIDSKLILGYYKHLLKLPQSFFDSMRIGEILSRINDAAKIRTFINDTAIYLIVNFFIVFFSFALLFMYNWKLALLTFLIVPVYSVLYCIVNQLNKIQERKIMETAADLESHLVESINSIKTIKQFGIEFYANSKTEIRFITFLRTIYKSTTNSFISSFTSGFINRLLPIVIIWVGAYYVIDGNMTPGELLSFYAVIGYFSSPLSALLDMNKTVQNALIASDRLFEITDLDQEDEKGKIDFKKEFSGDIIFENISFSYGMRVDVFKEFSLKIKKGQLTAIIGESGSGKSTITYLLQKIYPISEGRIFIGNQNIAYCSTKSLRRIVGGVPQQISLFSGNVVDNIALGDYSPDIKKIIDICEHLGILEFIEKLPNGLYSEIGENGLSLSGGQRQRIAIARALYFDFDILLLDEATSALDSESELYVKKVIRHLIAAGKTIILIAHRLSTVKEVDKIVVLENGKLMEEGTHEELMNRKEKYFNLWQKQSF